MFKDGPMKYYNGDHIWEMPGLMILKRRHREQKLVKDGKARGKNISRNESSESSNEKKNSQTRFGKVSK